MLQNIVLYFQYLWTGIVLSLQLNPDAYKFVVTYPESKWLVFGIIFLAGVSTLIGQSVVLFLNRVRRERFYFSLVLNGLMFIISYLVWGLVIYIVGRVLFREDVTFGDMFRLVGLSTAPLIFGFFVLIPWMGPFLGKVLNVWSFLILINVVQFEFNSGFWGALLCVGLGWLLMNLLSNTVGKPVIALRNRIWKGVTGSSLDATAQDILLEFSTDKGASPMAEGGKQ